MIKQQILDKVSELFPDVKIAFKDKSTLMKILGVLLFFNPAFMTSFITTIGSTIYFPSEIYMNARPVASLVILLHELTHVNDEKKISKFLFNLAYLLPQLLVILFLPLLLIFGWKIALFSLIFLAPLPAYFRMNFEKRAYMASLYVFNKLNQIHPDYKINLDSQSDFFVAQFKNLSYYVMWPFNNINSEFANAVKLVKDGKRPFEDPVFDILDQIIAVF